LDSRRLEDNSDVLGLGLERRVLGLGLGGQVLGLSLGLKHCGLDSMSAITSLRSAALFEIVRRCWSRVWTHVSSSTAGDY